MGDPATGHPASDALSGIRVLELGQLIAGPYCWTMLAGFGADVIKVEPPGQGDAIRRWRKLHRGTSLWWRAIGSNKRSITCNLRKAEGRDLVRRLVATGIDVVVENFRPGRMEAWDLSYERLAEDNPGLVMVRVSGYGQTGPLRDRPGFANVAEAFGGLRYVTGYPDRPPVRTGVSIGDTLAGMHGAFGALAALRAREHNGGRGQVVDVALYESVLSVMESLIPEYDLLGHVRERTGSSIPGIVPSGTYRCADGRCIVIGANSEALFTALMRCIERPDLATDPDLAGNDARSRHAARIDAAIERWTEARAAADALQRLDTAGVPSGPIQSAADLAAHPHVAARQMLEPTTLPDGTEVRLPAVVPRLSETPGRTRWPGPELGAHNREVYGGLLGLTDASLAALAADEVV
ncbi:MAG: CoA transferase [Myxococcota bacterium]